MKKNIIIVAIAFAMLANFSACNMEKDRTMTGNPLFFESNTSIDFARITNEHVKEATDSVINEMKSGLDKIYNITLPNRTFQNSIKSFDALSDNFNNIQSVIFLMAYVHPDSAVRNQSQEAIATMGKYINEVTLDENLYKVFLEFSETEEARTLEPAKARLLQEQIDDFNRNGFKLPEEDRKILKEIKDRISDITIEFQKNISEYNDFLIIAADDTSGLPADYLESRKQDDGSYKIDLSYPSYRPFMKYAENAQNREELQFKYLNRAADKNLEVLNNLLVERQKMAELLGYPSYATYALENKMVKTPENVWDFENQLKEKVKAKAAKDYDELLAIKNKETGTESDVINTWEASYYDNILLKESYQLDDEKLKAYFELDNVLDGLFTISQQLFGLKFEAVSNPSVWHPEVKMFSVSEGGSDVGYFYLDLHPRENKYNHAACFSMLNGTVEGSELIQIPTATLVCNFPKPTSDKPSLITHSDVETMFHEFGHLIHHLMAKTEMSLQAGISNSRDFVEVPSQFLENWAWSYESLKLFAKHYKTGELLPKELHQKMLDSRNVGSGIANLQQILYGYIDMTFHDRFDPEGSQSTTDVVKKLQNEITLYPYVEGTHFHASFGHLTGYAAGYYGYLWAKVYAEDCFSVFEKNGIFDIETGKRFRDEILAKGSSKEEMELIKSFLQREPNDEAFIKSLGL